MTEDIEAERQPLTDRPKDFNEYIGNAEAKLVLQEMIEAHKIECSTMPHILLYGPAGVGKTSLANIIASQADYKIIETVGSAIKFQSDVLKILMQINDNLARGWRTVLFIDEVHGLDKVSLPESVWYTILEDFKFFSNLEGRPFDHDGVQYKATGNMHISERFTVVAATTDPGILTPALRRRFKVQLFLNDYSVEDISTIIRQYGLRKDIFVTTKACTYLAERSRANPSRAISLVDACTRRYIVQGGRSLQYGRGRISLRLAKPLMRDMGIMEYGLQKDDLLVLKVLQLHSKGLGVSNLAKSCGLNVNHYSELIEPYLKKMNLIFTTHKTFLGPRGENILNELYEDSNCIK